MAKIAAEGEIEDALAPIAEESDSPSAEAEHEPTEREALTADLDRIRYRKLAILFSGICWGFFLCFIGLAVGTAIFFGLSAFDLLPSLKIPLNTEKIVFLCFAVPFLGPLVSSIWAFIRCGQLKRRIAALPE